MEFNPDGSMGDTKGGGRASALRTHPVNPVKRSWDDTQRPAKIRAPGKGCSMSKMIRCVRFSISGLSMTIVGLLLVAACADKADSAKTLRTAASDGDLAVVSALLNDGAAVDAASESGGTPLMFAAYGDHAEIVRTLLDAGADPNVGDRFGDPAIHWASYAGADAAVATLLEGGADPSIVTHHGDALAIAMRRGFSGIVERLVVHTGTSTGDTPLHEAARDNLPELQALIAATSPIDVENRIGYTPAMEAARQGHADVVRELADAGADLNHRGNDLGMGMTALHLAADRNQTEVIRLLISRGVDVNSGNAQGTTALLWALGEGATEAANALLDAGADPALEDEFGYSALSMIEYLEEGELRDRLTALAPRE